MSRLLFDIGGTTMRMATGADGSIENVQKVPTPERPDEAVAALEKYATEFLGDGVRAYGGIAGIIEDGVIRSSPNLPAWAGFSFGNAFSFPCHIQNDAELAGLGEAVYGAGKGFALVAYVGIGTGVGGSLIVNGQIAPHAHGFEPGHQILDVAHGTTFEAMVSGHALAERYGAPARELPQSVYDEATPVLASGLYNVILEWSPEVLVLGGSLMNEENGYRIHAIEEALGTIATVLPSLPAIKPAALRDDAGLYGALTLQ